MESQEQVRGPWQRTYTGRRFHPLDPRIEEIDILDIGHHLSLQCRYAGAVRDFYSLAQHSVIVSRECEAQDALWGLLHDSPEAYICDIPRPLKHSGFMEDYREVERSIMFTVACKFDLNPMSSKKPKSVELADNAVLAAEMRDLRDSRFQWDSGFEPTSTRIIPVGPSEAEAMFLSRFLELTTRVKGAA